MAPPQWLYYEPKGLIMLLQSDTLHLHYWVHEHGGADELRWGTLGPRFCRFFKWLKCRVEIPWIISRWNCLMPGLPSCSMLDGNWESLGFTENVRKQTKEVDVTLLFPYFFLKKTSLVLTLTLSSSFLLRSSSERVVETELSGGIWYVVEFSLFCCQRHLLHFIAFCPLLPLFLLSPLCFFYSGHNFLASIRLQDLLASSSLLPFILLWVGTASSLLHPAWHGAWHDVVCLGSKRGTAHFLSPTVQALMGTEPILELLGPEPY